MPYIIFTMLISILAAIFAIQNSVIVPVKFMTYETESSLAIVILGSVFLGLLIGCSLMMYIEIRNFLETRKKKETIKTLTDENILLAKKVGQLEGQIENLTKKTDVIVEKEWVDGASNITEVDGKVESQIEK